MEWIPIFTRTVSWRLWRLVCPVCRHRKFHNFIVTVAVMTIWVDQAPQSPILRVVLNQPDISIDVARADFLEFWYTFRLLICHKITLPLYIRNIQNIKQIVDTEPMINFCYCTGMWIIPVGLCIRNHWWRFPCIWLLFSSITAFVTRRSLEKPIQVYFLY